MRTWNFPLLVAVSALCLPATASAAFEHVVASGESLSSVAAADGLSVSQLAAANGISPDSELTAGTQLAIPPQDASASVEAPATSTSYVASTSAPTPSTSGGYLVQPGDTLSAIAARAGVSVESLAAANGLDPNGVLLAGATISVSASAAAPSSTAESAAPSSTAESAASVETASSAGSAGPAPTAETVDPSDVGSIASSDGISPSFAEAIADQESGFNNNEVSSTGATGVMQIEPGTWQYIGSQLGGPALAPDSATDNIRGGVLLLHELLDQTGGDPQLAAAGYYQGLASVREHGMYSDTQQYVNNVMALEHQFGG